MIVGTTEGADAIKAKGGNDLASAQAAKRTRCWGLRPGPALRRSGQRHAPKGGPDKDKLIGGPDLERVQVQ